MKSVKPIVIISFLLVNAVAYGQHINLVQKNISVEKLFKEIEKQSGYTFFYKPAILKGLPKIDVNVKDASIKQVLDQCFKNLPLDYLIIDQSIVIRRKAEALITLPAGEGHFLEGKVVDENGQYIPGVTIRVKGEEEAQTITDEQGRFKMQITDVENALLQFSYVGYMTNEIPAKGLTTPVSVIMATSSSDLDEVQILAYGTTTKRLSTGNITTITAAQIANRPVSNVLQALQNQVPGLFIQQNTGLPGGSFDVQIRAGSSYSGGNLATHNNISYFPAPLYIVDGVTYPGAANLPLLPSLGNGIVGGVLRGGNTLSYLNPEDIESVTILKDADATAVYGSRGAYGVIIIKTKGGKAGEPKFNVNFSTGFAVAGTAPHLLNTPQYLMLRNEALKNDGITAGPTDKDVNGTWPADRYTNWQKELIGNTAPVTNINLSYMGGNANTTFRIAGNYVEQSSVQKGSGDVKSGGLSFAISSTTNNNKFSMDLSGNFNTDINTMNPYDFAGSLAVLAAPNAPPLFLPNGALNWETGFNEAAALNAVSRIATDNLLGTLVLTYKPVRGLTLTSATGYNRLTGKEFRALPSTYFIPGNSAALTYSALNMYNIRTWNTDANADYTTTLGRKGILDVRAGITLQDVLNSGTTIEGRGFSSDALLSDPASAAAVSSSYAQTPYRYAGYFGHLNYTWDQKYILNLNGRYDGSTRFGPGRQFGKFGSVGTAWLMSEEKWFKNNIRFISFAKLKASYGTVGGDNLGSYRYLSIYGIGQPYKGQGTLTPFTLSNPDLQWQQKQEFETGLTLEFLNGRIGLEGNFYLTRSSNQLTGQKLSSVTGFDGLLTNVPVIIQTSGLELQMSTKNIQAKNFSWSTAFNIAIPHNKLLSYPGGAAGLAAANSLLKIGKPITGASFYNYAGVDPQTGYYNFINRKGVKVTFFQLSDPSPLSFADKTEFIDVAPKYYGSITNTFRYKNLSLGFIFSFTNRMGLNYFGSQFINAGLSGLNTVTASLARWQKPGDITNVPKVTENIYGLLEQQNFVQSTGAYSNATYVRLQNLNINYNFTPDFLKKAHIDNLHLFLRGENLLTISKFKDVDPETLLAAALPPSRVFVTGFNLTF
jgi:TonB-linked SusC/RagA family outer membrane protein